MCQNLHFSESCIKAHYVPNSVATGKQETVKEVGRSGDGLRMVSRVSVGGAVRILPYTLTFFSFFPVEFF